MVNEGVLCLFSDCEYCRFVSISRIRLLKKRTTKMIESSAADIINMSQACFRIRMVAITKKLVMEN